MTAVVPLNCSTKKRRRTRGFYSRNAALAEDVFHFVEDGGIAVGGLVFDFQSGAELFEELALLARELRGREDTDMIVEIAFAAATRVGETFALDAEDGAALGGFGNFEFFFAVEAGDLQLGAQGSLRDAERDGAVKIGAAAFEKGMFFDVEDNVEIARRAIVRGGLAFAGHAQTRTGID